MRSFVPFASKACPCPKHLPEVSFCSGTSQPFSGATIRSTRISLSLLQRLPCLGKVCLGEFTPRWSPSPSKSRLEQDRAPGPPVLYQERFNRAQVHLSVLKALINATGSEFLLRAGTENPASFMLGMRGSMQSAVSPGRNGSGCHPVMELCWPSTSP